VRLIRIVAALVVAALLFWPINPLVLAFMKAWGLPEQPTFADACLVEIIVLLCILLFRAAPRPRLPQQ